MKYSAPAPVLWGFGEVRTSSGTTVTDKKYTGQQQEAEIGLDYYVSRFYDPTIAHFVQMDPMIPESSKPQAFDRYAYVENNPIRFNDPTGHKDCDSNGKNCLTYNYGTNTANAVLTNTTTSNSSSVSTTTTATTTSKTLPVLVVSQPQGSSSCGEAVFTSVWNFVHPNKDSSKNLTLQPLIDVAISQKFYTKDQQPFTSPNGLKDLANYYENSIGGSPVIAGNVNTENQDVAKAFIVDQINQGNPVIIDASTNVGNPNTTEGGEDSHFIVVIGFEQSEDKIIYNDSFGYKGEADPVPGTYTKDFNDVWNSWINNSDSKGYNGAGWYLIIH